MAAKTKYPVKSRNREVQVVEVAASGAGLVGVSGVATLSGRGIASCIRGATAGLYVLTQEEKFPKLYGCSFQVLDSTAASPWLVVVTAADPVGAGTVTLQAYKEIAGTMTATDIPITGQLFVTLRFTNTVVV